MKAPVLARMHTGEHVFVASLIRHNAGAKVEKIKMDEKESSVFVTCPGLDWDKVIAAETLTNQIIMENRKVATREIPKQEAEKYPGLRIKIDRIKSDTVRIVEVEGHDVSACAGEHCSNTSEIGNFLVTGFNSLGNDQYEIRFTVDAIGRLYEFAAIARKLSAAAGADYSTLHKSVENLRKENEQLKLQARELQKQASGDIKTEKVGGLSLVYATYTGFEKKILINRQRELLKEKTVVCFINKVPDSIQVFIATSADMDRKAMDILVHLMGKFNGKGGGKDHFGMGGFEPKFENEIIKEIKKII